MKIFNIIRQLFLLKYVKELKSPDDLTLIRLHSHIISKKQFLRKYYIDIYKKHIHQIDFKIGSVVELGSGSGFIKELCPDIYTSDILKLDNVDIVLDAIELPFKNESLSAITFLNILHHISQPSLFFKEVVRILKPEGKLVFTEPHISFFSRSIYKYFHHEYFDFNVDIEEGILNKDKNRPLTEANIALPEVILTRYKSYLAKKFPSLCIKSINYHSFLIYYLSGGVNYKSLVPDFSYPIFYILEKALTPIMKWIGGSMTIVMEKR